MSNNSSLVPVKDLKPFKTKWRSQVKVLHWWLQHTGFGGDTLQMILTDEQGEKITASCKRNHILTVQRKLPLGKWRVLTTFSVSQTSGQYPPTSHPYKITITEETTISNSDLIQDSIFLSLARYNDIIDGTLKTIFLIDVMGKIVENCKIICSVEAVDTDWAWFYFGHKGCKHRAIKIGKNVSTRSNPADKHLWRCEKCQVRITEVILVFKLHLIVRDDTETCKLILLNIVAKTIAGHEVVDLWDGSYDEIEDPELLPKPIKTLVGKSFCFGISVSSENVRDGADTFKVLQILSGDHILNVESQFEPISMIGTSSSTVSSEVVLMLEGNSQNDSEECKTPFAKGKY
ncbi:hypothetical protein N665_0101s0006 [Sinapis alba]|nr:hypothetical protein N665_0101s0006 [Sinapis alba]